MNAGAEVPDFLLQDIDYDEPEFVGETKADQIDVRPLQVAVRGVPTPL